MRDRMNCGRTAIIASFLFLCLGLSGQRKDPTGSLLGRWAGLFTGNGDALEFELNVVEGGCLFTVPSQNLYGLPAFSFERRGDDLEVCLSDSEPRIVLSGKIQEGAIRGSYLRDGRKASDFSLKRSVLPGREGADYPIDTGKGVLPGTLLEPDSLKFPGKVPVVLILADSGPSDRDGNNLSLTGRNDCLASLARTLKQAGVASLRYDKRGSGEAYFFARSESDMVFEDFARDAEKAVKLLKADARFSKVAVIGHGQGSLVGSVAAARAGADAFISLAGVGLPAWKTVQGQLESAAALEGSGIAGLKGEWEKIIGELRAGRAVGKMDPELEPMFRPSIQPFLISWFSFDPEKEIAKLKGPVLIILGGNDSQVGPDDAKALEKGAPNAKEVFLPDMNHVLKSILNIEAEDEASYSDPAYPLASGLQAVIGDFLRSLD